MIIDFSCKETKAIWEGRRSRKLPPHIQQKARRKLRMLNNAKSLNDLRIPPNNRLEKLSGKRQGQNTVYVLTINGVSVLHGGMKWYLMFV